MFNSAPVSTILLVLILLPSLYGLLYNPAFIGRTMLHPYSIHRGKDYFTIVTSGFVHASWAHLLFNLVTFYFFAFPLEKTIGSQSFFLIYALSLVIADIPTLIKHKNDENYACLGASGAISGVLYSFILFYPQTEIYLFLIPIGIPAWIFAILYLAGTALAAKYNWGNINHSAHFTGAITGFVVTLLLYPEFFQVFLSLF